jgi:thiamine biosynthesis lipoprotein
MTMVRLARHAMATRFEILLPGEDVVSLRAAGEEALDEIERLEAQLSLFKPASEISRLNSRAAREPVRVTPAVFGLLQHAQRLTQQTAGAFDVTIAPLMRCWGFMGGSGQLPRPEELAAARETVGMHLVHLDAGQFTVRFERAGVMIDLGAIGKGYAIERAVDILREAGVASALLHGGTSTVYGLGHPAEADAWKVEIPSPQCAALACTERSSLSSGDNKELVSSKPFATVSLCDASLSVSAVWGKSFTVNGSTYGHIIDPRTGQPANRAVLAAVALDSATETDALSTALLTVGPDGHDQIAALRPGMRTLVAADAEGARVVSCGISFTSSDQKAARCCDGSESS